MNLSAIVFCLMIVGLTIVLKSWYDCGSDHDEGPLTYPGDKKKEED